MPGIFPDFQRAAFRRARAVASDSQPDYWLCARLPKRDRRIHVDSGFLVFPDCRAPADLGSIGDLKCRAAANLPGPAENRSETSLVGALATVEFRKHDCARHDSSVLLDANPILWLAGRDRLKHRQVWMFLGALALIWIWRWR